MTRVSLKIVGASGQGINSIGEIVGKGLKRAGYCVFGYREYQSLIKGGHASYQLDCSDHTIESSEQCINILITLNHHGLELNLRELKQDGIIIHSVPDWTFTNEDLDHLKARNIKVIELPVEEILTKFKAKPILGNVIIAAFVWAILGQEKDILKDLVGKRFAKKKDLLELNMQCIEEGFAYAGGAEERGKRKEESNGSSIATGKSEGNEQHFPLSTFSFPLVRVQLPSAQEKWKNHLLLTGSHAMGLGAVHAGVRFYAGYPMTPSSPLLGFIADIQNKTGMVIKQAEDEITAAQMVSGAMFMGTRALTATSGGGFDLMSETVSLNAIIENPTVFVLAQRPGPATGLPTWTAQGDLLLALHTSHGEFTRCVLSVSDAQDCFDLMPIAFNIAEQYQISVIVLTDKQTAEALYTQKPYDQSKAEIRRGIVTDPEVLKTLKGTDRFDPQAKDGISLRWLPGTEAATYNAQGDEHSGDGTVDESAEMGRLQMEKRMKKLTALKSALPPPELFTANSGERAAINGEPSLDLLLIGWGSTKGTVLDVLESDELKGKNIGYLHYTYMWPMLGERFERLQKKAKKKVLIEQNFQGQLGVLLKMETGIGIGDRILKYDGRPFFYDELLEKVQSFAPESPKIPKSPRKPKNAPII